MLETELFSYQRKKKNVLGTWISWRFLANNRTA